MVIHFKSLAIVQMRQKRKKNYIIKFCNLHYKTKHQMELTIIQLIQLILLLVTLYLLRLCGIFINTFVCRKCKLANWKHANKQKQSTYWIVLCTEKKLHSFVFFPKHHFLIQRHPNRNTCESQRKLKMYSVLLCPWYFLLFFLL